MKYNIDLHIDNCEKAGEEFTVAAMEEIRNCLIFPLERNPVGTMLRLCVLKSEWTEKRDKLVKYSVDYQAEWSKMIILEEVTRKIYSSLKGV